MNWIYTSNTESRKKLLPKPVKAVATSFFSSLFGSLASNSTPQRQSVSLPPAMPQIDPLGTSETSIILSVFSADIKVKLDSKLSSEIHRSTKKRPPSTMKYELIYVSSFTHFYIQVWYCKRLQKTNMMQVNKKKQSIRMQQAVFSKVYVLISKGMFATVVSRCFKGLTED